MKQLHNLMTDVRLNGQDRVTRSGDVVGVFRREFVHDMRYGLPFPTTKRLMYKAMMGELLWFINGKTDLRSLRYYSGLPPDAWTIWSNDCERWYNQRKANNPTMDVNDAEDLGKLYGHQWRNWGGKVDQLRNLVNNMKNSPMSRYLIVQAYNPGDIEENSMALPPCHTGFQVYVDAHTGEFDLNWTQRSVDVFLGLPFNIASYACLMLILEELTGLKARHLYGDLKDTHLYVAHDEAIQTQLKRTPRECNAWIEMPELNSLDDLKSFTAKDFVLHDYNPDPAIKAQLLVG